MQKHNREQHGMSRTPTYTAWAMMRQRCRNEKHQAFDRYGGRSITVCERWQNSFAAFLEDMGERPEGMTLDRIDNDGDYCPENCRWATAKEQANNTRRTRYVMVDGKKMVASVVAAMNNISRQTMSSRLANGWSLEQAVGIEDHPPTGGVTIDGETMSMAQWAARLGISRQVVDQRIKHGWDVKKALTTPKVDLSLQRGVSTGPVAKERNSALGELITRERMKHGLTQRELADRSGLTASGISNIETGKTRNLSRHSIEQLAGALEIRTEDIAQFLPKKGIEQIQYKWYDEWWKGGIEMNNDDKERPIWLQVRMSEEEKALLASLSDEYGLSISAFVRMMIAHFDDKRPTVSVRFGPKVAAPVAEIA